MSHGTPCSVFIDRGFSRPLKLQTLLKETTITTLLSTSLEKCSSQVSVANTIETSIVSIYDIIVALGKQRASKSVLKSTDLASFP